MNLNEIKVGMKVMCNDFVDTVIKLHPENDLPENSGNIDWGYTVELEENGMQSHGVLSEIN